MMMNSGGRGAVGSEDLGEKSGNGILFCTIGGAGHSGGWNPVPCPGEPGYDDNPKFGVSGRAGNSRVGPGETEGESWKDPKLE